jgi:mannose-6-phosphate isomerase-like protein (cupin superfamily)
VKENLEVPKAHHCNTPLLNFFILMTTVFEINHEKLADDPRLADIGAALDVFSPIDSDATFNDYCREACRVWAGHFRKPVGETSHRFTDLLDRVERRSQSVIKTEWGGVVVTLHEDSRVEKFLVIRKGMYLALEMHEEKDERLEVTEGAGLILWRRPSEQALTVDVLKTGREFHLEPGTEHCLIGTENLVVFERSIDPKGMDQDLIFIFEPADD